MCNISVCSDALQTAAAVVVMETVSCCCHFGVSGVCRYSRQRQLWEDLHEGRQPAASRRLWTAALKVDLVDLPEPVQQEKRAR